jgi:hypothetical protein
MSDTTSAVLATRGEVPRRDAPSAPKWAMTVEANSRRVKRQSHHP